MLLHRAVRQRGACQRGANPCHGVPERVALTHAGPGSAEPVADSSGSSTGGRKDFPTA